MLNMNAALDRFIQLREEINCRARMLEDLKKKCNDLELSILCAMVDFDLGAIVSNSTHIFISTPCKDKDGDPFKYLEVRKIVPPEDLARIEVKEI
jgi:hypothetical protein